MLVIFWTESVHPQSLLGGTQLSSFLPAAIYQKWKRMWMGVAEPSQLGMHNHEDEKG